MRTNKNRSKLILAATVAIVITMFSYSRFNNMQSQLETQLAQKQKDLDQIQQSKLSEMKDTYAYAIATTDLKAGEIVSDEDVDFQQSEVQNNNAFENRSDIVNKVLLQDIGKGQEFTTAHIAKISKDDSALKNGDRALTLPADNFQGRSNTMQPGSLVDVYSASADSSWVLEAVKILSYEGQNAATGIVGASAITFEVPTDSVSDFISNVSKSKLVLVARNASDKSVYRKKPKASLASNYNAASMSSLPNLPTSVPIKDLSGPSGLPQPVQPVIQPPSVEVIEANVKSKVTFD